MRDTTERPEAVDAGTVSLVGTRSERITAAVKRFLDDDQLYQQVARSVNPYGDGQASGRIVNALTGRPFKPFLPQ
ncbi:UDP-N-acetylglucosamine 2-epimerase [compost metagenome]